MKHLIVFAAMAALATPVVSQTKSVEEGEGYSAYVSGALQCMSEAPGDATAQDACIVAAVEECKAKSGVYEACLGALRDGFDAAIDRIEAEELKVCDGDLDNACTVVLRGHALIRSGQGLNAQQWTDALIGTE